jgi:hypothetical protein
MFDGNKWARQSAIVVLIHAAAWILVGFSGIGSFPSYAFALLVTAATIFAIHNSDGNMMFKNKNWKDEATVTLIILAVVSYFMGGWAFPITAGVTHALVWYIRKKTGGDKQSVSRMGELKIGSPF